MNAREILVKARALLEDPTRWMQDAYNKDADGNEFVDDAYAICWCAEGALLYAIGPDTIENAKAQLFLENAIGGNVPGWNDAPGRTHAEILAGFDAAIARASDPDPTCMFCGAPLVPGHTCHGELG